MGLEIKAASKKYSYISLIFRYKDMKKYRWKQIF